MKSSPLSRRAFVAASVQSTAALALPLFGSDQATSGVTRLPVKQARAIVIGGDGVITIAADRKLIYLDAVGRMRSTLDTLRPVRALCHDAQGRLWMTFSDQVARLSAQDTPELVGCSFGKEAALTGIAVAEDGRIFVADSARRAIWRLDDRGMVLGQIRPGDRGFAVPRAFFPIKWHDGHLIVAEPGRHQVHRFTAGGEKAATWGTRSRDDTGFAGCCNPVALAPMRDGSLITVERGAVRVKRFDAAGRLLARLSGPESFAERPATVDEVDLFGCDGGLLDVATDKNGRVIVLDRATGELRVLS